MFKKYLHANNLKNTALDINRICCTFHKNKKKTKTTQEFGLDRVEYVYK